MKCPHCNKEHPGNFQFCPETGLDISLTDISSDITLPDLFDDKNSNSSLNSSNLQTRIYDENKKKKSLIFPILTFTSIIGFLMVIMGILILLDIFPVSGFSSANQSQPLVNVQNTIDISKFLQANTPEISSNTLTTQNALLNPSMLIEIPSDESHKILEETANPDSIQSNLQPSLESNLEESTPTPTSISTSTLTPTDDEYWAACPGYYLSRLHVGDKAKVSEDPPLSNRVRSKPNSSATILGYIEPGEKISILDGPSCNNSWIWWKMTSEKTGLTGWTVEGDGDDYWLVPSN